MTNSSKARASIKPACERFILWVDAVGGYLVCLGDEVTIGQAGPDSRVDVPIVGDLSRAHARIRRSGEGYVIESAGPGRVIRLGGRTLRGTTAIFDGEELELGPSVRFRFRQPNRLSSTARLDFLSNHRTHPSADGIVLMAESCILGPALNSHIVCRDWSSDMVLYRRDGRLHCRGNDQIEVDGRVCKGSGLLLPNSHVVGADFALTLETI